TTPARYTLSLHDALPILTSHSSRHIARRVTSSTSICRKYYRTLTLAAGAFRYRGSIRSFPRSVHGERPTGFVEDPVRKAERDDRSEEHTSELQSRGHLVC